MDYFKRTLEPSLAESLNNYPVTALLGPRQCGKSTLARRLLSRFKGGVYLDLERPSDLSKLQDPELFFASHRNRLVCIDEIQRKPELFPVIRALADDWGSNGRFLVLGSASRDLIRQSSESLAGRIAYKHLAPFSYDEIPKRTGKLELFLTRGGFPRSLLAPSDGVSFEWRENFIASYLERDLLFWTGFTPVTMRRLWSMLAHENGQTVNYSRLAGSLAVSDATVRRYIDLLKETFMVEVLPPYCSNLGKRLVKAPKVYLADTGITTALLNLNDYSAICGHPVFGSLWEQMVLAHLKSWYPHAAFSFYRTAHGAEIDIVMEIGAAVLAIECKASLSPSLQKGTYLAAEDIRPAHTFVAAPVKDSWKLGAGITVVGLSALHSAIDAFAP